MRSAIGDTPGNPRNEANLPLVAAAPALSPGFYTVRIEAFHRGSHAHRSYHEVVVRVQEKDA